VVATAAPRPRLLRPSGPQAGRPPGRGADEHPGHQGGRGRRRLRGAPGPGRGPTTPSCPGRRGSAAAAHRAGRGDRGAACRPARPAGPGGHEAAVDPGPGPGHRGRGHRRPGPRRWCAALGRDRRPRRRGRRRGRGRPGLADALLEKTGGDSLAEVRRNLDAYLDALGC
jgi:hypothetical protein